MSTVVSKYSKNNAWQSGSCALEKRIFSIAASSLLIAGIALWATTTPESRTLLMVTRAILVPIGATAAAFHILVLSQRQLWNIKLVIATGSMYSLGYLLARLNGVVLPSAGDLAVSCLVTCSVCYVLYNAQALNVWSPWLISVVIFAFIALLVSFALGGVKSVVPPRFGFSGVFMDQGPDIEYSQSASKFYGMAAVLLAILAGRTVGRLWNGVAILGCVLMLYASAGGGGRGDFLAAASVCTLMIVRSRSWLAIVIALGCLFGYFLFDAVSDAVGDSLLAYRLSFLLKSFGSRDSLAIETALLIARDPALLILGGGFGYFQHANRYDIGMYPHNVLLELITTFGGLPVIVAALSTKWLGVRRLFGSPIVGPLALFFVLIGLKSGALHDAWFVNAVLVLLVCGGFCSQEDHRSIRLVGWTVDNGQTFV